jgi:predicted N-acyltransferase
MTSTVDVRVFKTVESIDREAIDSLVDDGFFTYGWFKTLETSKLISLNPFYISVFNKSKMIAFAPCFRDVADQYFNVGPAISPFMRRVLKVCNQLHIGQNHILLCCSPLCYRTKIFADQSLNKGLLASCLLKEVDAICKKEKILFSSFQFVSEYDQNLSLHLNNWGYHRFFWKPTFYLDVRWQSFEDYLSSLEHDIRNKVRREIRSCRKNGVIIEEIADFKDLAMTLSDLSSNLLTKYNRIKTRFFEPSFFESLSDYAKSNVKVFIARKKGAIVGFSLCLRQGKTLDVFHCGFNYELQEKSDFTYFNLCYYSPIRWAIQEGIRKIYYRLTAERVKLKRGCKPERIYSFVKCHNKYLDYQIGGYMKIRNRIERAKHRSA